MRLCSATDDSSAPGSQICRSTRDRGGRPTIERVSGTTKPILQISVRVPAGDRLAGRPADPRRPTSWARDNRLICALGTRDGSMVPAAQMERYEPVAEVSTWPRTAPDIDPGTGVVGYPCHGEMSAGGSPSSPPQGEGVPGWSSSPPKAMMRPSRSATVTVSAE